MQYSPRTYRFSNWLADHIYPFNISFNISDEAEIIKKELDPNTPITPKLIRKFVLDYDRLDLYNYAEQISNKLNKIVFPEFDIDLENKLRDMFTKVEEAWHLIQYAEADSDKKQTFFNFSYIINRLLRVLKRTEYLGMFTIMKTDDKIQQYDVIFKKVCECYEWNYE